ncbi:hypothetical protein MRB53_002878 [Persea americana]|uniref:Uncharacterized protein n=1 Tax=Persea americana TaxID=3435 RepID=A0ACC2MVU1_PERAE|nr:hypothetical protein MRB53_002878 [Persea americana]
MLSIESPVARLLKSPPIPARKPLQPKNIPSDGSLGCRPKPKPIEISIAQWIGDADKENRPISAMGSFDASLAEELEAIRRKKERLRREREKTERVLREREMVMEKEMREMERRGREQRKVEMELEKILRFKDLKASCLRIRPVQSLREKEQEMKNRESLTQEMDNQAAETEKRAEPMMKCKIAAT